MRVRGVVATLDHLGLHEGMNHRKPLLSAIGRVQGGMRDVKERVRTFHFEVVLSPKQRPECGEWLKMARQRLCSC